MTYQSSQNDILKISKLACCRWVAYTYMPWHVWTVFLVVCAHMIWCAGPVFWGPNTIPRHYEYNLGEGAFVSGNHPTALG